LERYKNGAFLFKKIKKLIVKRLFIVVYLSIKNMAHLEVKPRSRSTWWIWLIILIIIIVAAYYYFYVYKGGSKPMVENHPYMSVATAMIKSIV